MECMRNIERVDEEFKESMRKRKSGWAKTNKDAQSDSGWA
jgi:hypothetical protein